MVIKTSLVVLICSAVVFAGVPPPPSSSCTNYCEEGKFGNYICCDEHLGQCPVLRPECPNFDVRSELRPTFCEHDGHCAAHQKCCRDACFPGEKLCKPARY